MVRVEEKNEPKFHTCIFIYDDQPGILKRKCRRETKKTIIGNARPTAELCSQSFDVVRILRLLIYSGEDTNSFS